MIASHESGVQEERRQVVRKTWKAISRFRPLILATVIHRVK